ALRSFVPVGAESHFPIQNLPFGVFRRRTGGNAAVCVAIGEYVLDLALLQEFALFAGPLLRGQTVFSQPTLNALLQLGRPAWAEARATINRLLRHDLPGPLRDNAEIRARALIPQAEVEMLLPVAIGDYTDFYSSKEHASNVGTMLR